MRKIVYTIIAVIAVVALTSCSLQQVGVNSTGAKAVEEAKLAVASGKYEEALGLYKLARDEGNDSDELAGLIDIIDKFILARNCFENGDVDTAESTLKSIPAGYGASSMADAVDKLAGKIEAYKTAKASIDEQLEKVQGLFAAGDYNGATVNLDRILSDESITPEQKKTAETLKEQLNTAKSKIEEEKNKKSQITYVYTPPVQQKAVSPEDINGAGDAVRDFCSAYEAFVTNGGGPASTYNEYMSPYSVQGSKAYNSQWNYYVKNNIQSFMVADLIIHKVTGGDDTFYVYDTETIIETKNGTTVRAVEKWTYTVVKSGNRFYVTSYTKTK